MKILFNKMSLNSYLNNLLILNTTYERKMQISYKVNNYITLKVNEPMLDIR